jgi:hypothetical protein
MSAREAERDELIRQHTDAMTAYKDRLKAEGSLSEGAWASYGLHALALGDLVLACLADETASEIEEFLASLLRLPRS